MGKESVSNELRASMRDALGSKVKIEQIQTVLLEGKADRTEQRILLLSKCRCYIVIPKVPVKIENSFHFLEVSSFESTTQKKLIVHLPEGKRYVLSTDDGGKELDAVVGHIMLSLAGTFPSVPLEKLVATIDVKPIVRLKEFADRIPDIQQKALMNPCGNFSASYESMCDLFAVEFMEDVAWDIDTIYLSHGTKEMNLGDFDHLLDGRQMAAIVSALEHNQWFTGFNTSNVKLSSAASNELVKVLKSNSTLEELVLPGSSIKADLLQRLSLSLAANSRTALTVLDLSDNFIEDKGIIPICLPLAKLGHGLTKLKLSRTGLTSAGVCRVAETLLNNTNMLSSLRHLDLSNNALRGEDITSLYNFLAQPNVLTQLILASIDSPLEFLFATLLRGCTQHLAFLDLSGNFYSAKKQTSKEVSVPLTWQQFFSSSCALKTISLANVRLPAEAVKSVMLGITANSTLKDVELNLSGNALGSSALQVLEACLPTIRNIAVLDLSDNGLDSALATVVGIISQNRSIRRLALGRNLNNFKQSVVSQTMDALVGLIQIEDSCIEHLILDDLKLRAEITIFINALGLNSSLTHLDISGNQMGDIGARMLSKALQINKKLVSVKWDLNGTSSAGFQYIASALEKNYTLKEMPTPLNDAAVALRNNQAKTERALRKIELLLQRNHCPQKFVGEQEYRLQQGFLASSFQQVDTVVCQIQNSLAQLQKIGSVTAESDAAMKQAEAVLKDADASRQLLLHLEKVAFKAENKESQIGQSLTSYAKDLENIVEKQLKDTASEMVQCAHSHCPTVLETEESRESARDACVQEIKLPPYFIQSLVINQIGTEIINKTAELNLAIATHLSDKIADEATSLLESSNNELTLVLRREARSGGHLEGNSAESKEMRKILLRQSTNNLELGEEVLDTVGGELPVVNDKRKTLLMRRNRPMSNIDPVDVRKAMTSSTTVAATTNEEKRSTVLETGAASSEANISERRGDVDARSGPGNEMSADDQQEKVEPNEAAELTVATTHVAPSSPIPLPRKRKPVVSQKFASSDLSQPSKPVPTPLQENKEQDEPKKPVAVNKAAPPFSHLNLEQMRTREVPNEVSEPIPATPSAASSAVEKQPEKQLPKTPTTPKVIKVQNKATNFDLPGLNSEGPKLQCLGADRPRRPKNKAMTRPTVGLDLTTGSNSESISDIVDGGVDDFFSASLNTVTSPSPSPSPSPAVLNGKPESTSSKDVKKLKSQISKGESKGFGGFMKDLMSKVTKGSGVAESSVTQAEGGHDSSPNKSPSDTLDKSQNKSPSNTLDKSQSKSPSNMLEKDKSLSTKVGKGNSFGASDVPKEKDAGPSSGAPVTRPVAAARYGLPGMSSGIISELPKRVKPPIAEGEKSQADASCASDRIGKEHSLNSASSNGKDRPISSHFQSGEEMSTPSAPSSSFDKEPDQTTQLPPIGAKDPPVANSRLLTLNSSPVIVKETPAPTVADEPATKLASAVADNDEVASSSRNQPAPKVVPRAPPPLAPKPKGGSRPPSGKVPSSVYPEQPDGQRLVKLVESGESDTDKGEELDRNSNVKKANDVTSRSDSNKIEAEDSAESSGSSHHVAVSRASSTPDAIESDGGSDSVERSDNERNSPLELSISAGNQSYFKDDNTPSAEKADEMQPVYL